MNDMEIRMLLHWSNVMAQAANGMAVILAQSLEQRERAAEAAPEPKSGPVFFGDDDEPEAEA
jgi:hypothetical protein